MIDDNEELTASELLNQMRDIGFVVYLNGENLHVKPRKWIDSELMELIKQHKTELIDLLTIDMKARN